MSHSTKNIDLQGHKFGNFQLKLKLKIEAKTGYWVGVYWHSDEDYGIGRRFKDFEAALAECKNCAFALREEIRRGKCEIHLRYSHEGINEIYLLESAP